MSLSKYKKCIGSIVEKSSKVLCFACVFYIINYCFIKECQLLNTRTLRIEDETVQWKNILLATAWGKYYSSWQKVFNRQIKGSCPENRCRLHTNLSAIKTMDAVLFNALSLPTQSEIAKSLVLDPTTKAKGQVWVFVSAEPPPAVQNSINLRNYKNFFNWTMTYRADSDVVFPFGLISKKKYEKKNQFLTGETFENDLFSSSSGPEKKLKIAWLVSRCVSFSKREKFVEKLHRYIKVDVYGGCGEKCGVRTIMRYITPEKEDPCDEVLKKYHFYLALENSICHGYVTEKFYRALKLGLIPIVFRRNDYDFAPPNSFISVDDFKTIKEMAEYLNEVIETPDLYRRYHEWRRSYSIELGLPFNPLICGLCEKLHSSEKEDKHYGDIEKWFSTESNCITWESLGIH